VTAGLDAFRGRVDYYVDQLLTNPSQKALIAQLIGGEVEILLTQGEDGYRRYLDAVHLVQDAALGIDLDDLGDEQPPAKRSPLRVISEEGLACPPSAK
jgi:hypothetical protein